MTWSKDREIRLSYLWTSTEMSAAQIANDMGGFEHFRDRGRSAVLGKVMRMGLPQRKLNKTPKTPEERAQELAARDERRRERERKRYAAERAAREQQAAADAVAEILKQQNLAEQRAARAIPFDDLRPFSQRHSNQCRYIVNDDPANYLYCAAVTAPGESWCPSCRDVVMAKPAPILSDEERFRRALAFKKNALARSVTKLPTARDEAA